MEDHPGGCTRLAPITFAGMTCHQSQVDVQRSVARCGKRWPGGFSGARAFPRRGTPTPNSRSTRPITACFSVIEQVDKRFLKDRFGANHRGNLYKAYCGDVGCATLEHRTGPGGDDSGRQYYRAGAGDNRTYRLKTNEDDPGASTYDDPGRVHQDDQRRRARRRRRALRHRRVPRVGRRHHERARLPQVGGRQRAARQLGQLLRDPRPTTISTIPDGWAPQTTSCTRRTSRSSRGTTTTAWVSITSARNGSTPTFSTGPATPGATGGTAGPHGSRWCRTCCATATTGSITWITWRPCSRPSSTGRVRPADRGRFR